MLARIIGVRLMLQTAKQDRDKATAAKRQAQQAANDTARALECVRQGGVHLSDDCTFQTPSYLSNLPAR